LDAHIKHMPHPLICKDTLHVCVGGLLKVGIARASPHISPSKDMIEVSCLPLKGAIDGSGHQKLGPHPIRFGKFGLGGLLIKLVYIAKLASPCPSSRHLMLC